MTSDSTPGEEQGASSTTFEELGARIRELHPEQVASRKAASIAPAGDTPVPAVSQAVADARRKAAVLGWFKPQRLAGAGERALKERVLSALVADCDIQTLPRKTLWRLRRDARREELSTLAQHQEARNHALRDTEAEANDSDSRLLRRVVRGRPFSPARVRDDDRSSLLHVAEWTEGIFKDAPKTAEVRGLLARDAIQESLDVLAHRFCGREAELKTLRRFVFVPGSGPAVTVTDQLPVLGVSGIGGVGKSALLARLVDRLLALPKTQRPAVVLIDFDRARFSSGDPLALTFELTRQIAAWFPSIGDQLQELRRDVRLNLLSSGFSRTNQLEETVGLEAIVRSTSEVNDALRGILARAGVGVPGGRPLVVVLDTFEILQGAGGDDGDESGLRGVSAVARWAEDLFSISGLSGLRLLVSGRAPIGEDPSFGPRLTEPELRLRGLDPPSAQALLRDQGLPARNARLVVEAVGDPEDRTCNPLILRLAARLVKGGTIRPESLKQEATGGRKILDQELVQGILYRRILAHIGDRATDRPLAALAHPGLVLRRVTPDIIAKVLVPLTDLKMQGRTDPRQLFDRLRQEVWLVQPVDADTVVHRTDLRRTMLRLIDADMPGRARKIHRAAIRYYGARSDSRLDAESAAAEAFYHRLMLMNEAQAARLDAAEVRRFETTLYPNLEDLPPHVLAVVKSILDRPLTDQEGTALPEQRRTEFILRQGERHLLNDEPYRALKLLEAQPNLHPPWELRALAVTAGWSLAKERGLLTPPDPSRLGVTPSDVHERANLASWVSFCLGDWSAAYACAAKMLTRYESQSDLSTFPAPLLEVLARAVTYRTLAARDGGSRGRQELRIPWRRLREEQLRTTSMALEATRHAVLSLSESDSEPVFVMSGEAIPPSMTQLAELLSSDLPQDLTRALRALEKRLKKLPRRFSSGQVLGTIARCFPKAAIIEPARWGRREVLWPLVCPNPEFRGPVKFALLEAFTTEKDLAMLAEWGWSLTDLHPQDLRPDVFAKTASRPGKAGPEIATLVLYLDRSAALGRFLSLARLEKPNAAKLALVADAFRRWERAFQPIVGPVASIAGYPS